jgi:uncharacterized protein YebE (UPF0316 family)
MSTRVRLVSRIAVFAIASAVATVVGVLAAALNDFRWALSHIALSVISFLVAYLICKDEMERRDRGKRERLLIVKAAKWINNPVEARRARERTRRVLAERRHEQEMLKRPEMVEAKALIVAALECLNKYGMWIHVKRGKQLLSRLNELDDQTYLHALKVVLSSHQDWARVLVLAQKLGKDVALDTMVSFLYTHNGHSVSRMDLVRLAEMYVNSGQPRLVQCGLEWLREHGYAVEIEETYWNRHGWGGGLSN